jgi:hypothetical protein
MTTKICDLCAATFDGKAPDAWLTVKWMPGLHLSSTDRFQRFLFREYCGKCATKVSKVGNVDFDAVPANASPDAYQADFS